MLAVRVRTGASVEVLTPVFLHNRPAVDRVVEAAPEVFNHNVETVPRLYSSVRAGADYHRSLELLRVVKSYGLTTKSGIMLGLGEKEEEIDAVLCDLRSTGCDRLTVGQYLQPTRGNLPVVEYKKPEFFSRLKKRALELGFEEVVSTPLARSSYYAE